MRMHPAALLLNRVCNEPIEIESVKGKKFLVEKGLSIIIPVLDVHYDPENYENPEEFSPERFDDGGIKDYKDKCVFLAFGDGPRMCLGNSILGTCKFEI